MDSKERVRAYGKVYSVITKTIKQYVSPSPLIYFSKMNEELYAAYTQASSGDEFFPTRFYRDMADAVLRWAFDGFVGVTEDCLVDTVNEIWKFHKRFLLLDRVTDESIEGAVDEVDALPDVRLNKNIRRLYVAVLMDIDRLNAQGTQSGE